MVGDLIHLPVYQRQIERKHIMNVFDGVGISVSKLRSLRLRGVRLCRFIVFGGVGSEVFYASLGQFERSDKVHDNKLLVGDVQVFVSFSDMVRDK